MTWPQSLQPWSWHRFHGAHLPESHFEKPTVTRYWNRQGECSEDDSALRMQSGTKLVPRELSILVQDQLPEMYQADPPQREVTGRGEGEGAPNVRTQGMELIRYRIRKTQPSRRRAASSVVQAIWVTWALASRIPAGHEEASSKLGASHHG